MGSNTGSYIAGSSNMSRVKATACKPNDMDYFCEKNSISQCEKKCLAFRGSLHYNGSKNPKNVDEILSIKGSDCEQCDILDYCRGGCTASAYSYSGDFKKCDITRKPLIIELLKKNGETGL
jgi:radical SAM protein with 4Fe4S-binding SPASM domain